MSSATYGLHGREIKVQLLKEKEPGNCEDKKSGVISLNEVVLLSVTVYFAAILFSLRRFLKLLSVTISECCVQLHKTNITYTLSSTRGYSGVIYKNNKIYNNKITMGQKYYICYNKK